MILRNGGAAEVDETYFGQKKGVEKGRGGHAHNRALETEDDPERFKEGCGSGEAQALGEARISLT